MTAAEGQFDLLELSSRIEDERSHRCVTWAAISQEAGVATSTIRRFATASDAEADGVLALIGWLEVAPEQFVVGTEVAGAPLPSRGHGVIRVDMERLAELAAPPRRARPVTRTTIQRLVAVAQASRVSVASGEMVARADGRNDWVGPVGKGTLDREVNQNA